MSYVPHLKPLAIIFAAALLLYGNTLPNGYAYDDVVVITKNPHVQEGLAGIPWLFANVYRFGEFKGTGIYRPVAYASHAIEYQLFGDNVAAFHFFNVLYYAICCWLLFLLLLKLFPQCGKVFAACVVALFLAHPVHTEAVANIKGRDEVLCLLFGLLSLLLALKHMEKPGLKTALGAVLAFVLALLSKEAVVTFLAVLPLALWFKAGSIGQAKQAARRVAPIWGGMFLAAALFFVVRVFVNQGLENTYNPLDNSLLHANGLGERLATTILIWGKYLKLLLVPHPLVYYYGYNHIPPVGFADWRVWATLAGYAALAFVALKSFGAKRAVAFGIAFFVITLSVYGHIVTALVTMAERSLFMPSAGFCIAAVGGLGALLKVPFAGKLPPLGEVVEDRRGFARFVAANKTFSGGLGAVLLACTLLTWQRNTQWKDNLTLFSHDIAHLENAAQAHADLAKELIKQNRGALKTSASPVRGKIAGHLGRAVQIYPDFYQAWTELGGLYMDAGELDKAEESFGKAVQIRPDYGKANYYLAKILYDRHDFVQAAAWFEKTLGSPLVPETDKFYLAARALCRKPGVTGTDLQRAEQLLLLGLQQHPSDLVLLQDAARVCMAANWRQKAAAYLDRAYRLAPNNAETLELRGRLNQQIN